MFACEMGANLPQTVPGHDVDLFDDYCEHLLVRSIAALRPLSQADRAAGAIAALEEAGAEIAPLATTMTVTDKATGETSERAITLAWDLLTREFQLPKDRLTVTVYHTDDEAHGLWKRIAGLPDEDQAPQSHEHFYSRSDAPRLEGEDHSKDIDFTPAGIRARCEAGYRDTMEAIREAPWTEADTIALANQTRTAPTPAFASITTSPGARTR